jgi:hypothetical protein
MRRLTLAATILAVGTIGCDRLPFIGGGDDEPATQEQPGAPIDTAEAVAQPPAEAVTQPQEDPEEPNAVEVAEPEPRPRQQLSGFSQAEVPWTPTHTGTVEPGMTRDQVVEVWGDPVTERALGAWSYLYFRNGCEISCGTYDVVLLDGGQVVDAIVRGRGHVYAGVSSSPPERAAEFTPPTGLPGSMGT